MENKRDNLKRMLEQAEERLIKENQKTALLMTIYYMVLCGIVMHLQDASLIDIIIGAVFLGGFISWLTIAVYSFYTSIFTKKEDLEKMILKLKIEIDRIERNELSDETMELMKYIDEDDNRY